MKKRIGIGYKNYKKQCAGLEFRLIPKFISWAGLKPKNLKKKFLYANMNKQTPTTFVAKFFSCWSLLVLISLEKFFFFNFLVLSQQTRVLGIAFYSSNNLCLSVS